MIELRATQLCIRMIKIRIFLSFTVNQFPNFPPF